MRRNGFGGGNTDCTAFSLAVRPCATTFAGTARGAIDVVDLVRVKVGERLAVLGADEWLGACGRLDDSAFTESLTSRYRRVVGERGLTKLKRCFVQ